MIVLNFTAEYEDGEWNKHTCETKPTWGWCVVSLNGNEVKRIPLTYNEMDNGNEGLSLAVTRWLSGLRLNRKE